MAQYPLTSPVKSLTVPDLAAMKRNGEKISCLTAYDASFSSILDQAGVDILLVGDSLGMVVQGHVSTIPVSIEDMVYHTSCVERARKRAFVVSDLPFMSYATPAAAAESAAKLLQEGGAQMVKLEGPRFEVVRFLVDQGVPVCGHLGLLPQSINQLGSYRVQGKGNEEASKIIDDALKLEQAGASLLVLECIPSALAGKITGQLQIPVIGIGAGPDCDGQVLVLYDMLGISAGKTPRFSRNYLQNAASVEMAVESYVDEIKSGAFPAPEHCF